MSTNEPDRGSGAGGPRFVGPGLGLAGSRVLVTGAGGGIGTEVVAAFVREGAVVAAADLKVAQVADGHRVTPMPVDLRESGAPDELVRRAVTELGGLDVVVHLAGVLQRRPTVLDVTEADWDLQHDVNLKATFFLLRAAAEQMREQGGGGRLIAAVSQSWWTGGFGGSAVYAASKGGVVSLCRGLAREYGPHGITVNTVAPGAVDTPMLRTDLPDQALDDIVAATPAGRLGQPADVAGPVLFLASPLAGFVTASTLNVSGGWLVY